jgi:hypothetical protein
MTAININVNQLITILTELKEAGVEFINLDMLPDEKNPGMNKLIVHPVNNDEYIINTEEDFLPHDPSVNTDNNDIFGIFKENL